MNGFSADGIDGVRNGLFKLCAKPQNYENPMENMQLRG